jgi:hydroxymethylglutaryl-CoA reductase
MGKNQSSLSSKSNTSLVPLRALAPQERIAHLRAHGYAHEPLPAEAALDAIENGIGALPVPLGIATGFIVDGEECLVTLATEERTVVAGASYAAKLCRDTGGFRTNVGANTASGQVLFSGSGFSPIAAYDVLRERTDAFTETLRRENPLRKYGCDIIGMRCDMLRCSSQGFMVTLTFEMEVGESMGANVVTRVGEMLAALAGDAIERRRTAVICTNASQGPSVFVTARWPCDVLGEETAARILDLHAWAEADERRAVTHNKGVMNGVSAVCLATGQDVRAVEAAAHFGACESRRAISAQHAPLTAFARVYRFLEKIARRLLPAKLIGARRDERSESAVRYMPLTRFSRVGRYLEGSMRLNIPLGTVGAASRQPAAVWCRELMHADDVKRLAAICAAVGLAQNFAALRSLAGEGILDAHARLAKDAVR